MNSDAASRTPTGTEPPEIDDAGLRDLIASVPGAVYQFVLRDDGSFDVPFMSEGAEALFERTLDEIRESSSVFAQVHADDVDAFRRSIEQSARSLDPWSHEFRITMPFGRVKWVRGVSRPRRLSAGHGTLWSGVLTDITDRVLAETALRESHVRYHALIEQAGDGIFVMNTAGKVVSVNEAFARIHGYTVDDIVRLGIAGLDVAGEGPVAERMSKIMAGETLTFEVWHRHRDGHTFPLSVTANLVVIGNERAVIAIHRDLSERKRAEASLAESGQRLQLAASAAQMGIWDWDIVNNKMTWDDQMFRLYGIADKPAKYGVEIWENGLHPDDRALAWDACQAAVRGERGYDIEFRVRHPDGTVRHIKADGVVLRDDQGRALRMLGVNYDITERKRADEALRQSEASLLEASELIRAIVDSTSDLIWSVDAERHGLISWNQAVEAYFRDARGLTLAVGMRPEELFPAGSPWAQPWHAFYDRVLAQGPFVIEQELSAGTHILSLSFNLLRRNGKTTGITVFGKDITARRRAEAALRESEIRLRQAEKMNAVGQLAGGVAHDFNNQLMSVLGNAELLLNRLDTPDLKRHAESIMVAARRSADLTKKLLAFSRKGQFQRVPVDVHRVIHDTVEMLVHSIDRRVRVTQRLSARAATVQGDPSQIQSALLNLALNARDAMPEGGELTLGTDIVTIDAAVAAGYGREIEPGPYLLVTVSDTGCGMTDEVKAHLFEPFFTTKSVGQGTGMGLASVFGTVKQHRGMIKASSEIGKGTEFRMYLPLAEVSVAVDDARSAVATSVPSGLRILVADDAEPVRALLTQMLAVAGHEVVTVADGAAAIEAFRRENGGFDLVILDMIMPVMNGRDAFRALKASDPAVKVMLASGYGLNEESQALMDEGVCGLVQKPFEMRELLRAITAAVRAGSHSECRQSD